MFHPSQRWHQGESPGFQHGNPPGKSRHPDMTSWFFTTRLRWPCADPFFLRSQPILPSASHNPDKKSDWFVQICYVDYLYRSIYIYIDISIYLYRYIYIYIYVGMSSWRLSRWSYCRSLGQRQAKVIEELGKLVAFCTRLLRGEKPGALLSRCLVEQDTLLIAFFSFGWYPLVI